MKIEMRVSWLVMLFLLAASAGCAVMADILPVSATGEQRCPTWARCGSGDCQVKFAMIDLWYQDGHYTISLEEYDQVRVSILDQELLIENAQNIVIAHDDGTTVPGAEEGLLPGIYLFMKEEASQTAEFTLAWPPHYAGSDGILLEYVDPR